MKKYDYSITTFDSETTALGYVAEGLKALANEKSIANNLKELELMLLSGDKTLKEQAIDRLKGK